MARAPSAPGSVEGLNRLFDEAQAAFDSKLYEEAEKLCHRILSVRPRGPRALHLLGLIFHEHGRDAAAAELIDMALESHPDETAFLSSKAFVQMALYRPLAARAAYERLISIYERGEVGRTPLARAYSNLASTYLIRGEYATAARLFDTSLELDPERPGARWNRGYTHLIRGELERGWPDYEARLQFENARRVDTVSGARPWDGRPFAGKRLLVHDEQGFGDVIQFARYLPLLKRLGGTLIFETQPELGSLLEDMAGVDEMLIREGVKLPADGYDLYVALLSLPQMLGTTIETIPADTPYIRADPRRVERFRNLVRPTSPGSSVGLVWGGKHSSYIMLRHRSCPLRELVGALREVENVNLYGLQKGDAAAELGELPPAWRFPNLGDHCADFADTAAAVAHLDLVISIDTAVAHLAGAMHKPVWLMLSHPPDWRWFLEREDCPWYPSMRIFRGKPDGAWADIFGRVAEALALLARSRSS